MAIRMRPQVKLCQWPGKRLASVDEPDTLTPRLTGTAGRDWRQQAQLEGPHGNLNSARLTGSLALAQAA
jgi:hypothetical protein